MSGSAEMHFGLENLDPAHVVQLDLGSELLRQNFIRELSQWATRPPFYAVHAGAVQVICSRYADAVEIYRDRERFSVEVPSAPGYERFDKFMGVQTLAQLDGARHDRLRSLMSKPFGPAAVAGYKQQIVAAIESLLDDIAAQAPHFDAQQDLGQKLIPAILLDRMFHLNDEQKQAFKEMSELIPLATRIPAGGKFPQEYRDGFARTRAVINRLIDERRATPGGDLISALVTIEEAGDRLTADELYDQIFTITAGALQSTASSLVAVLWVLGKRSELFEQIKIDPTLIPAAIEEALRYHGAGFLSFPRFATVDTEVGGTPIYKGMTVRVSPQAASYDPLVYPDPLTVDIHRKAPTALVFGSGVHHCLGNRLARLVLTMTLERLLARFPNLRLADADKMPHYRGQVSETQIASLPMRFD